MRKIIACTKMPHACTMTLFGTSLGSILFAVTGILDMPKNAAIKTDFICVVITNQSAVLSLCETSRASLTKATTIVAIAPSPTVHLGLEWGLT